MKKLVQISFIIFIIFVPFITKADLLSLFPAECSKEERPIVCGDKYSDPECGAISKNLFVKRYAGEGMFSGLTEFCIPQIPAENEGILTYAKNFPISLVITLILEILVALIFIKLRKNKGYKLYRIFGYILLANIISLPILWSIFYFIPAYYIYIGEVLVVCFEAWFLKITNKDMTKTDVVLLSLIMNIASYFIGNFLLKYF